jgi:hypothetical protein
MIKNLPEFFDHKYSFAWSKIERVNQIEEIEHPTIKIAKDGVKGTTGNNSNKDGLYGAICNVVYYEKPLTKMALIYHYNLYTIRNPPV